MNAATFSGFCWTKSLRAITQPMESTVPPWPAFSAAWPNSSVTSSASRKSALFISTLVTFGSGSMTRSTSPAAASVASSLCSALYSTVT